MNERRQPARSAIVDGLLPLWAFFPLKVLQVPVVRTCSLRNWNPRPACGTAFSSVHPILSVSTSVTKSFDSFHPYERRGVQHLWSTARNEAKTTDGKGSRTLDPVPAMCFTSCDPNFPWFASMVVLHDTSRKPFSCRVSCS